MKQFHILDFEVSYDFKQSGHHQEAGRESVQFVPVKKKRESELHVTRMMERFAGATHRNPSTSYTQQLPVCPHDDSHTKHEESIRAPYIMGFGKKPNKPDTAAIRPRPSALSCSSTHLNNAEVKHKHTQMTFTGQATRYF